MAHVITSNAAELLKPLPDMTFDVTAALKPPIL